MLLPTLSASPFFGALIGGALVAIACLALRERPRTRPDLADPSVGRYRVNVCASAWPESGVRFKR